MTPADRGVLSADRKYELLRSLSQSIRGTLNLDEILEQVLDVVHAAVPYDAAGVFVLNRAAVATQTVDPRQHIRAEAFAAAVTTPVLRRAA